MSFLDSILGMFGGGNKKVVAARNVNTLHKTTGQTQQAKNRQVFQGKQTELPEWLQGINKSEQIEQLDKHAECKFKPKFEIKKIMAAKVGADGNLMVEYDGIAGDCGALKNFGMKVAQMHGMTMPFKYFDLNNAIRACCGNPKKCPFYMCAEDENSAVNALRR